MARAAAVTRCLLAIQASSLLTIGCAASVGRPELSVWVADERTDCARAGAAPQRTEGREANSIHLEAARGETIGLQVVLHSRSAPAGPYTVELGDLGGSGGSMAAAQCARRFCARYVRVSDYSSWYPEHTGRPPRPAYFPDVLVPWDAPTGGGPIQLDGVRDSIVWVDWSVPDGAAAGDYSGSIRVLGAAGAVEFEARWSLRVLAIAMPLQPTLPVVARCDPRSLLQSSGDWPAGEGPLRLLPHLPEHAKGISLTQSLLSTLKSHQLCPVLWAGFPRYEDTNDGGVEVSWADYDALVASWLDGPKRARYWPVPASVEYPDAERYGGFESARYSRALARYLGESEKHFRERGWQAAAFVRLVPPAPLNQRALETLKRAAGILRQSEAHLPLAAHLPSGSLRGLGWYDAPPETADEVDIWIGPGMWFEPERIAEQAALGKQSWLMPEAPPYCPSLQVATCASDPISLAWLAFRYGFNAIWVENAAEVAAGPGRGDSPSAGLVYSGAAWGMPQSVVPSMRLKRLRRGVQDHALLTALAKNGKSLLARKICGEVVRWGLTDAAGENLLARRETGWEIDGGAYLQAQRLVLRELGLPIDSPPASVPVAQGGSESPPDSRLNDEWGRLLNPAQRVQPEIRGVRLLEDEDGLHAAVFCAVSNDSSDRITVAWSLPNPPAGWRLDRVARTEVGPGQRRLSQLTLGVDAFSFNVDGVYPFEFLFEQVQPQGDNQSVAGRLAIAACPLIEHGPTIDGRLDDWQLASNNAAGDFRLVRPGGGRGDRPVNGTQAFFAMDVDTLYIAVRCGREGGGELIWRSDNEINVDRGFPWGQEIVEVLLDPRGTAEGGSGDLYCLQIKPNGLLLARKGCRTSPPMGPSETWVCDARVSTLRAEDAWVAELALPLAAFGKLAQRSNIWGCNITRLDAHHGEYSSWSGARSTCYLPLTMGNLVLLRP